MGNGERYYSPQLARFTQQDSFTGMTNMPQSLNRYSYVYNNPFGFRDPSGNIAEDNRGALANSAREYGINKNGETSWGGFFQNAAARTGYDLWDLISFGALSRQEETVAKYENREITNQQFHQRTFANIVVSGGQAALTFATGGAAGTLTAGAGIATRVGVGIGLGIAERFAVDNLEMAGGFRQQYSSAGEYALAGTFGGLFGAAAGGKAKALLQQEGNLTIRTELRLLKQEAGALGSSIGRGARNFAEGFTNYKRPSGILRSSTPEGLIAEELVGRTGAGISKLREGLKGEGLTGGRGRDGNPWEFDSTTDIDWRGTGKNYIDAYEEAFKRTGYSREDFEVTKWAKDKYNKSIPVEFESVDKKVQVNMDIPEWNNIKEKVFDYTKQRYVPSKLGDGPHQPHIGYTTPKPNALSGHIFIDNVPATRR